MTGDLRSRPTLWWVVVLASIAAYANSLNNPFVIDDVPIITEDVRVTEGRLGELLFGGYWPPPQADLLYRPLVKVSYALNWMILPAPWTFRIVNLALHIAASCLVLSFCRGIGRAAVGGVVAAVLFALHPIHTEVLNTVVGRADLAATVLGLLAILLYWRDGWQSEMPGWRLPFLATICFAAALLCKEAALPLAVFVVVVDLVRWHPVDGTPRPSDWWRRRVLRCHLPLALSIAGYLALRVGVLGAMSRPAEEIKAIDNPIAQVAQMVEPGESEILARWGTPIATFGRSALMLIWPWKLSWDYSYAAIDIVRSARDPHLWTGLALLAAATVTLVLSLRRSRGLFLALVFAVLSYSIISNTAILIGTIFAERLLYLPSVGTCMAMGIVAGWFFQRRPRRHAWLAPVTSLVICIGIVAAYQIRTTLRNRDWRSPAELQAIDLKSNPRSVKLLCTAGRRALGAREMDRAKTLADEAISIAPWFPGGWRVAGLVHLHSGEEDQALDDLKKSLELGGAADQEAVTEFAQLLIDRKQFGPALALLRQFVREQPHAHVALNNLAWQLVQPDTPAELRNPQEALQHAQAALRVQPDSWGIIDTYAAALMALGRHADAQRLIEQALARMAPDDPDRPAAEALHRSLQAP